MGFKREKGQDGAPQVGYDRRSHTTRPRPSLLPTGDPGTRLDGIRWIAHAYWKIAKPLAATRVVKATGELVEPIERANLRLVHRLGVGADCTPDVAASAFPRR